MQDLKAYTWHDIETKGEFDKNNKLTFIGNDILIVGCDTDSEAHYAGAIDTRGRELSQKVLPFSNTAEGFTLAGTWMLELATANGKKQIVLGLDRQGTTGSAWWPGWCRTT